MEEETGTISVILFHRKGGRKAGSSIFTVGGAGIWVPRARLHSLCFILFETGSLCVVLSSLECPMWNRLTLSWQRCLLSAGIRAMHPTHQPSVCAFNACPLANRKGNGTPLPHPTPSPHLFAHSLRKNSYDRTSASYLNAGEQGLGEGGHPARAHRGWGATISIFSLI